MAAMRYLFILCGALILFSCASIEKSHADVRTAASCSLADVNTAYNSASAGDIVAIPSGECTWTAQLQIRKAITLRGSGSTSTIINHGYSGDLVYIDPSSDVPIRITEIYLKSATNDRGYTSIFINGSINGRYGLKQIRIDHNKIEKGTRAIHAYGWVEGVIDNNVFINCNIAVGLSGDDSYSWDRPIAAGTKNALFIEDNIFINNNNSDREPGMPIYHQQGARSVTRFNTFDSTAYTNGDSVLFDSHGNWGNPITAYRGQPIIEVYNNTFKVHHTYLFMDIRGGSSLIYNNAFSYISGSMPMTVQLWEEEAWTSGGPFCPSCPASTGWPAQDQINNTFIWDNTLNGSSTTDVYLAYPTLETAFIQKDRDYYLHAPQPSGGKETYSGPAGGAMTFTSTGANAYYPYQSFPYPHPLRTKTFNLLPPANLRIVQVW